MTTPWLKYAPGGAWDEAMDVEGRVRGPYEAVYAEIEQISGERFRRFLSRATRIPFVGVLIGAAVTAWLGVQGYSIPGMEEMAAQFNLPARIYPETTWLSTLIGPAVVFVFSLLAAVYPALRLRRLHPVEAMRSA